MFFSIYGNAGIFSRKSTLIPTDARIYKFFLIWTPCCPQNRPDFKLSGLTGHRYVGPSLITVGDLLKITTFLTGSKQTGFRAVKCVYNIYTYKHTFISI